MRCLISCPKCESEGRKYILGELAPTGHVLIQRVHGKNGEYRNFTIVGGSDFYLVCDHCGMKIFFREIPSSIMSGTVERRDYGTLQNISFLGTISSCTKQEGGESKPRLIIGSV